MTERTAPQPAHEGETRDGSALVFVVVTASLLIYVMQFGMVSVGLKDMIAHLDAPIRLGGWVLTIFMIGQVLALSVSGRLVERYGARRMYVTGFGTFVVASLACGLAPNIEVMIATRFMQGLGGGALFPAGTGIIAHAFPNSRARAIGLFASVLPFGAVLGPTLGGLIIDYAGWRWTFLLNVPLGVAMLAAALVVLPRTDRRSPTSLDVRGVMFLAVAITAGIFMLTELGRREPPPDLRLVLFSAVLAVAAAAALVRHERRVPVPVVDLELLRRREFLAANLVALFLGVAWVGVSSMVPLYVQTGYGISASGSGALMAPRAAIMGGTSTLAAFALARTGYRIPILVGLLGIAASLGLMALGLHDPSIAGLRIDSFWWLLLVVAFAGIAFGFANPSLNNATVELAPDRVASITGLRATFQTLGGTLGISLMVLLAERMSTVTKGLEVGFAGAAVILVATTILLRWVPDRVRPR